jgi:predicted ester cyclase
MTSGSLARTLYHLLDGHRIDDAVDCLAIDFRGHGLGSDRAGFRAEAAAWIAGFPDLSVSVRRLVIDDTGVAAWITLRGSHRGRFAGLSPTGRPVDVVGADLLVERDGRFVEAWGLRDLNSLWIQLGALPGAAVSSNFEHHYQRSINP